MPQADFAGRWNRSLYCKPCYPLWRAENDRKRHAEPEYVARANAQRRARYAAKQTYAEDRKQAAHAYRVANPEHVGKKKAEWQREHPERVREAVRQSRRRYPERAVARTAARAAIKRGLLVPQPCWCGNPKVDAHHHNGYAPEHMLDVVWLCRKHHGEQHRKYPRHE
jgi:hypothetical protein